MIDQSQQAGFQWGENEATSYWDLTDVFEEGGFAFANNSFNGNFGLVNVHGVPKPAYRAFQLLHELGDELLASTVSSNSASAGNYPSPPGSCESTVGVLASTSNSTVLSVLLYSQATIGAPIAASCTLNVTINAGVASSNSKHAPSPSPSSSSPSLAAPSTTAAASLSAPALLPSLPRVVQGSVRRIDEMHTSPKAMWQKLGMPQWPTAEENARIFDASIMQKEKLPIKCKWKAANLNNGSRSSGSRQAGRTELETLTLTFSISVPANGVVAVQVPLVHAGGGNDVIDAINNRQRADALAEAKARLLQVQAEVAELAGDQAANRGS